MDIEQEAREAARDIVAVLIHPTEPKYDEVLQAAEERILRLVRPKTTAPPAD
jgi:vacuolar-type H+-ATPase subunit H